MKQGKLKYIILGIGLGFLISALVWMQFATTEKQTLSEPEIVEKAKALGMVFLTEKMAEQSEEKAKKEEEDLVVKQLQEKIEALEEQIQTVQKQEKTEKKAETVEKKGEALPQKEVSKPAKTVSKPKNNTKQNNTIKEVIQGGDQNVKPLAPPKDPNRPQNNILNTNHF